MGVYVFGTFDVNIWGGFRVAPLFVDFSSFYKHFQGAVVIQMKEFFYHFLFL
jgi:hypothetical protein